MASFEALDSLTDEQLDRPIDEAHDWSGRDLIAHLVAWQSNALQVAKELAVGETSATKVRSDAEWDERGDAMNLDIQVEWRALPMDEACAASARCPASSAATSRWCRNHGG